MCDTNGISYARKEIIMTVLLLGLARIRSEAQMSDKLQEINEKYGNCFDGEKAMFDDGDDYEIVEQTVWVRWKFDNVYLFLTNNGCLQPLGYYDFLCLFRSQNKK